MQNKLQTPRGMEGLEEMAACMKRIFMGGEKRKNQEGVGPADSTAMPGFLEWHLGLH